MPTKLVALIALGTAACGASESAPDDLAGETSGEDAGKQDGQGAFTYWQVEKTAGGYVASRPNRTSTECGDGVRASTCDVASVDLTGTAMPDSVARGYLDRLDGGEGILLRGELEDDYGPNLASADLAPPTGAAIHSGDDNGPDCLYARLYVQDVDVASAAFTATPTGAGTFEFHARFGGVSIPSTSDFAMSCVNGTSTIDVKIATLTTWGTMTVAADGTISLASVSSKLDGVTYDSAKLPPDAIMSMLFDNQAAVAGIVTSSAAGALGPMVKNKQHGSALGATEVWVPGSADATDLSGVFVLATSDGSGVRENRVNSTRSAHIEEVDLAASGAADEVVQRATAELGADGVLLVGYRYIDSGKHGRAANQFWTKAPVPLH